MPSVDLTNFLPKWVWQDSADVADEDEEPELDAGGFVLVPSSMKIVFPIAPGEFLSEVSGSVITHMLHPNPIF